MSYITIIIIIVLLILFICYFIPKYLVLALQQIFPSILFHFYNNTEKLIALTFDGIPCSDQDFSDLLDILEKYNIKSTIFITSRCVENTDLLIKAIKDGHQLANHGKTGGYACFMDYNQLTEEIQACDKILRDLYSLADTPFPEFNFYRPGYGFISKNIIDYTNSNNMIIALGSIYPWDTIIRNPYINYIYIILKILSGDIIIMHNINTSNKTMEYLFPWLNRNNYNSITLDKIYKSYKK